jgi:outer membrane protein assembly factor BamB
MIWACIVFMAIIFFCNFTYQKSVQPAAKYMTHSSYFSDLAQSGPSDLSQLEMYRGNEQRNAVFDVKNFSKVKFIWQTSQINFGIHGASKASVVADQKNIYVGSDTSWFYCIQKNTGQINWKFHVSDSPRGIHSTAVLDEQFVYFGAYNGSVYKLNKKNGELIWSRRLGDAIGASPLISDTYVTYNVETVSPDNGYLVQLNKMNGEIIWTSVMLGQQSHSSPALSKDQKTILIGVNDSTVQGFDYTNGERRWTLKTQGPLKSTAWIDSESGYISGWGKELLKVDLKSGLQIWKANIGSRSQVSPALSEKYNIILVANFPGDTFGIAKDTGEIVWTVKNKIASQKSSPVVLQIKNEQYFLFFCADQRLCLIHPQDGKLIKSWKINGDYTGSLYIRENILYLAMDQGSVAAYSLK